MKKSYTLLPLAALLVACAGSAGTNPIDLNGEREPARNDRESASSGSSGGDTTLGSATDQQSGSGSGNSNGTKKTGNTADPPTDTTTALGPQCTEYYTCCIKLAADDANAKASCEALKKSGGDAAEATCKQALDAAKEAGRC